MKKTLALFIFLLLAVSGCSMHKKECICSKIAKDFKPTVHFAFNSAALSDEAKTILRKVPHKIKNCPQFKISISGYADSTGTVDYNLKLGQKRAEAVESYLHTLGLKEYKMHVHSFGSKNPVASNDTAQGRTENRRVEVLFKMKK